MSLPFYIYANNLPNPPDDPADDVAALQLNTQNINLLLNEDHIAFNADGGGWHKQITFGSNNEPLSGQFPLTNGILFTKLVNALPELFYYSGTTAQSQNQYAQTAINGGTFMLGSIIVKWGQVSFAGNAPNINIVQSFTPAFPNACFTVFLQMNNSTNSGSTYSLPVTSVSPANFTWSSAASFPGASKFYWMAIGN